MKNFLVLPIILLVSGFAYAQTTETKYYSSYEMTKEVAPEKAKFVRAVSTDASGVVTTTTSHLKNGTVTSSETFRGDEPYGIWIYGKARGTGELDYNFDLVYSEKLCGGSDMIIRSGDFLKDDASVKYLAPKFAGGKTMMEAAFSEMIYPAYARRRGIQGKVMTSFTITKEGKVKNVVVNEGVNMYLDKEAVRVIRTMKFSTPAMMDGEPEEVCVSFPITFKLG